MTTDSEFTKKIVAECRKHPDIRDVELDPALEGHWSEQSEGITEKVVSYISLERQALTMGDKSDFALAELIRQTKSSKGTAQFTEELIEAITQRLEWLSVKYAVMNEAVLDWQYKYGEACDNIRDAGSR